MLSARLARPAVSLALVVTAASARADEPQPSKAPVVGSIALPPAEVDSERPPSPPPAREYLGVEAALGGSTRLSEPADGGRDVSSSGLTVHLGAHYGLSRRYSLGLAYESAALGTTDRQGASLQSSTDVRRLSLVGLEGRVHPLVWPSGRLFLGLFLGLGWESATQTSAIDTSGNGTTVTRSRCAGTGDPSMALGLSGGFDYELGRNVSLLGRLLLASARLPDAPVEASDRCFIPTGGSPNILAAQLGISVRFDLSPRAR